MALSRDEAAQILADRNRTKKDTSGNQYTDEERKRRDRARSAAWRDASAAVGRLHPDEHRALYEVAVEQRLKEAGF